MDTTHAALNTDLKRFCQYDAATDTYRHGDLVFSAQSLERDAEHWFEVVLHVCELAEESSVEAMASALGTNYYQLRLSAQPVFFGLKSDPATLVLICRFPGQPPATQDLLSMLKQFGEQVASLRAEFLPG